MIKTLLSQYPTPFRIAFTVYAFLILWASLRTGGGPQPIEHFDKVMHFAFYGLFTVIAAGCTTKRKTFIMMSILIVFYGVLMEFLQSFVPSRFMSLADIVANTSGIIIVVALFLLQGIHNQPNKINIF
jgi:VanZ family protein